MTRWHLSNGVKNILIAILNSGKGLFMKENKFNDFRITANGKKMNKIDMYKWKIRGNPGEFAWIDKADLAVDHSYQRENINNLRVNEFASNWDWVKCGVLIVVIRNDQWFVIDGQHRKLAADKRSDIKELPCMIFELEGQNQEAQAFVDINTNKTSVASFDRFRAMIVAGDQTAIELNDLMKTTGHYPANSSARKAIRCLMTLWRIYKKDKQTLTSLWPLITDIHQDSEIKDSVLKSVYGAEIAARKAKITLTDSPLKPFLIKMGAEYISAEIRKEKNITGLGGARIETNALIKLINKQRIIGKNKLQLVE